MRTFKKKQVVYLETSLTIKKYVMKKRQDCEMIQGNSLIPIGTRPIFRIIGRTSLKSRNRRTANGRDKISIGRD